MRANSYGFGFFGYVFPVKNFSIDGEINIDYTRFAQSRRTIGSAHLKSHPYGISTTAAVRVAGCFYPGKWFLFPFWKTSYSYCQINSYTETGSAFRAQSVSGYHNNVLLGEGGMIAAYNRSSDPICLTPFVRVSEQVALFNKNIGMTLTPATGSSVTSFTIDSYPITCTELGAGFDLNVYGNLIFFGEVNTQLGAYLKGNYKANFAIEIHF